MTRVELEAVASIPRWKLTDVDEVAFEFAVAPSRHVAPLAVIDKQRPVRQHGLAFTPDGKALLRGTDRGTVIVYDLHDPSKPKRSARAECHELPITTIAVTHDGKHWLTGSEDRTVKLWSAKSKKAVRTFKGHTGKLVRVLPAGDAHAISVAEDHVVRVWELATGQCVRAIELGTFACELFVSRDGKRALGGLPFGVSRVWNLATGAVERELAAATFIQGPDDHGQGFTLPRRVALSPAGDILVSCGLGMTAVGADTGVEIARIPSVDNGRALVSVVFLPDRAAGLRLRAGDIERRFLDELADPQTRVAYGDWLEESGRLAEATSIRRHGAFRYVLGVSEYAIYVLDLGTSSVIARTVSEHPKLDDIAVSPDGRLAAVANANQFRLFDLDELLRAGVPADERQVDKRAVSNGGVVVDVVSSAAYVSSISGDRPPFAIPVELADRIAITPDERTILTMSTDGTVRAYDATTGASRGHARDTSAGDYRPPQEHAFLRDGRMLVTSMGGSMTMWTIDPLALAQLSDGDAGFVQGLAIDEDRGVVVTGRYANDEEPLRLDIWELPALRLRRTTELAMSPAQYLTAFAFVGDHIVGTTSKGSLLVFDREGAFVRGWKLRDEWLDELVVLSDRRVVVGASHYDPILIDVESGAVGEVRAADTRHRFIPGTTRAIANRRKTQQVTLVDFTTSTRFAPITLDAFNFETSPDGRYAVMWTTDNGSRRVVLRSRV